MDIKPKTKEEIERENLQRFNEMLIAENEQLRADLDYVSAMADIPLEVAE